MVVLPTVYNVMVLGIIVVTGVAIVAGFGVVAMTMVMMARVLVDDDVAVSIQREGSGFHQMISQQPQDDVARFRALLVAKETRAAIVGV